MKRSADDGARDEEHVADAVTNGTQDLDAPKPEERIALARRLFSFSQALPEIIEREMRPAEEVPTTPS